MELSTFILFAMTTFVVVFSPGPAAITITAQGSGNGVGRAQFGIVGVASANAIYFALSATGIASLIIASNVLFILIKWLGIAYLTYLGLSAIFSRSGGLQVEATKRDTRHKLFVTGFVVEFANPKALLYFAAILPQFLNTVQPILPQIAIMGLTTLLLDIVVYSAYAKLGQTITKSGVSPRIVKALNRTAGSALLFSAFKMMKVSN